MKLIVGITGATGAIYGIRFLKILREIPKMETHLIISEAAAVTIKDETNWSLSQIENLASYSYSNKDIGARISSGSFQTDGMVVIPCSIKTMSSIAYSLNYNLMTRTADVTVKEGRKLVLMVRETPLHVGHLRTMANLAERQVVILPPLPAFYHGPKTIEDIVDQTIGKILDQFQIENTCFQRWQGSSEP